MSNRTDDIITSFHGKDFSNTPRPIIHVTLIIHNVSFCIFDSPLRVTLTSILIGCLIKLLLGPIYRPGRRVHVGSTVSATLAFGGGVRAQFFKQWLVMEPG